MTFDGVKSGTVRHDLGVLGLWIAPQYKKAARFWLFRGFLISRLLPLPRTGNLKLDQRRQKVTAWFVDVLSELVSKAK